MIGDDRYLLAERLRSVSRAFYLTLRVLPRGVREPVGLAYLLARVADTIADTTLLPPERRLRELFTFRERIERGPTTATFDVNAMLATGNTEPEGRRLLESLPRALAALDALPEADRARVRSIVTRLTMGMEYDLKAFPAETSGRIAALDDAADLDHYTYLVAGCVGEFWTATAMAHVPSLATWDYEQLSELGVRFGKALQLTNVLRDAPRDLRMGRCYLPLDDLSRRGLSPRDLLRADNGERARPVLVAGIRRALELYGAGEQYLRAIPRRNHRLRLAVLWPLLIGLATLGVLARNRNWLDPERPSKIPRWRVYRILAASAVVGGSNRILGAWITALDRRVRRALGHGSGGVSSPPGSPRAD